MGLNAQIALSVLGVAIASYLTWVGLTAGAEPFCSGLGDCVAVQGSEYGDIAGIPIAAFGLAMYFGLAVLTVGRRVGPFRAFGLLPVWTFSLAFAGTLYSAYLTYIELFVLNAICVWCVVSAVVVTAIFVLSIPDFRAAGRARIEASRATAAD
jgi:uncharacterized membrane protein